MKRTYLLALVAVFALACSNKPQSAGNRASGQSRLIEQTAAGADMCDPANHKRPFIIEWDATDISKVLAGKQASVSPWIGGHHEGLSASASPDDMKIMFELMHLAVTAPRFDEDAFEALLETAGKGRVASIELFDLYRGEKLGAGKKSLAYHVLLQAPDKTLSDGDAAKFLGRVERLIAERGGELRKE